MVFKTAPFDRSGTPPQQRNYTVSAPFTLAAPAAVSTWRP